MNRLQINEEELDLDLDLGIKKEKRLGMRNFLFGTLNTAYHTVILILHVFAGYIIGSMRYEGFGAWKTKNALFFYFLITLGYSVIMLLESHEARRDADE